MDDLAVEGVVEPGEVHHDQAAPVGGAVAVLLDGARVAEAADGLVDARERLGVDESTVNRWEKDIGPMSVKFLREMSELFSCTTDYIVGRSQERTISRA